MDDGQGGGIVPALQIGVEGPQLADQEHALVDHGAAGQGDHVGAAAQLLEHPPGHVELSVKVQAGGHPLRPGHKGLGDIGHLGPGPPAQDLRAHRHRPPAQDGQALPLRRQRKLPLGLAALPAVLGEEEHPHTVGAGPRQGDARLRRRVHKEGVGDLGEDAHPVAGLALGVLARPVLQLFHDLQGVVHRPAAGPALYVHHRADAAGIVLKFRAVQPFRFGRFFPHASRLFLVKRRRSVSRPPP